MKNANSFLGYSRLAAEMTAGAVDQREQIDLSTEHAAPAAGAPLCHNMRWPNQWPSEAHAPGFRAVYTDYMRRMGAVSRYFTSLIAEAIQLPPTAFDKYFDADQQHKLKIVRYPDLAELNGHQPPPPPPPPQQEQQQQQQKHEPEQGQGVAEGAGGGGKGGAGDGSAHRPSHAQPPNQGVGPHKDSMLTTYLLQATHHRGLQVQNVQGAWIDCAPVAGTLVVAIGQGMEALTQGVCVSTTHRVLSPAAGSGARFSIPFFQGVRYDADFDDLETVGVGAVPEAVRAQRRRVLGAQGGRRPDDVEFTFRAGAAARTLGEATLRNRVKSHPDVGARWYPDILRAIRAEQAAAAAGQAQ